MLRENKGEREQMEMVCIEEMVPKDLILRKIDSAIDFTHIYYLVGDEKDNTPRTIKNDQTAFQYGEAVSNINCSKRLHSFSPTATNAVLSGNDWFTLGYMSVVYMLISEKEKNANLKNAEKN